MSTVSGVRRRARALSLTVGSSSGVKVQKTDRNARGMLSMSVELGGGASATSLAPPPRFTASCAARLITPTPNLSQSSEDAIDLTGDGDDERAETRRLSERAFALLPKHDMERDDEFASARQLANAFKNRYANILANDSTRVRLRALTDEPPLLSTDYINANYIFDGASVAAAAATTSDEVSDDGDGDAGASMTTSSATASRSASQSSTSLSSSASAGSVSSSCSTASSSSASAGSARTRFIACQAPLQWTFEHFWRMVVQEEARAVVSLTRFDATRAPSYLPGAVGETRRFADFAVELLDRVSLLDDTLLVQRVRVSHERAGKSHTVTHLLYSGWPDFGVPESGLPAFQIYALLRELCGGESPQRVIVHCSAGVGRAGTFITLSTLLDRMLDDDAAADGSGSAPLPPLASPSAAMPFVLAQVARLRKCRANLVQTPEQLEYVVRCLVDVERRGRQLPPEIASLRQARAPSSSSEDETMSCTLV